MHLLRPFYLLALVSISCGWTSEQCDQWDWAGHEPIETHALPAGLEPARALDIGGGVSMDLVLVPAGRFTMGFVPVEEPDWEELRSRGCVWQALFLEGLGFLLLLVIFTDYRCWRTRTPMQFSLGRLIVFVLTLEVTLAGWVNMGDAQTRMDQAFMAYYSSWVQLMSMPAHEVTMGMPYYMGKYEITQEQYAQVMGGLADRPIGPDRPVVDITWDDAREFCRILSERTGQTVRLPSEAEWEYACREGRTAGNVTIDGESMLAEVAWFAANSERKPHPVGQKAPNAFGLYDMLGNAWEWVEDDYHENYEGAPADGSAWVTELGHDHVRGSFDRGRMRNPSWGLWKSRVARGGSCFSSSSECDPAYRREPQPWAGFRVVVEVAGVAAVPALHSGQERRQRTSLECQKSAMAAP